MSSPRSSRLCLVPLLALGLGACATTGGNLPAAPPPEAIPGLERDLRVDADNPDLLRRLGAAQRAAGQPDAAVGHLERATDLDPADASGHFFLALTYEDLDRPGDAIEAYRAYQARSEGSDGTIDARIRVLQRKQLRQAVRSSLAREDELRATRPNPGTVAVFPFLFAGGDESLRPLSRAIAALLVTDLSQTDRLRVLERMNVQALVDEMELGESGLVDPATAARSGHLLGAGSIVQGRLEGDLQRLTMDAAVVQVTDPETGETRPLSLADAAEELFAMETQLALEIYEELGISLTPAERVRVTQQPTRDLQALLAYGEGLEASDRGDFAQAAEHFRRAVSLDPDFEEAEEEAEGAEESAQVFETSTDDFAALSMDDFVLPDIPEMVIPNDFEGRDPGAEFSGSERPTSSAPAVLIIRPGGGGDR